MTAGRRGIGRMATAGLAVVLVLASLLGLTAAYERGLLPGPPPTTIEKAALRALWRGQRAVTIRNEVLTDSAVMPPTVAVEQFSLIIATPTGAPVTVVKDSRIETAYVNVTEAFKDNAGALVQRGQDRVRQRNVGIGETEDTIPV